MGPAQLLTVKDANLSPLGKTAARSRSRSGSCRINEVQSILSAFPELKSGGNTANRRRQTVPSERTTAMDTGGSDPDATRQRGRRPMSAAARKAASDRMKQYWAKRRKAAGE